MHVELLSQKLLGQIRGSFIDSVPKKSIPAEVHMRAPFHHSRTNSERTDAYVGSREPAATGYHDADFDWEDYKGSATQLKSWHIEDLRTSSSPRKLVNSAGQETDSCCWEAFHSRDNATAKFYKERRYLLLEFPCLLGKPPLHILELGCGCGSSVLPILKANPSCHVTAADISPTAIASLKAAAESADIAAERLHAFTCNGASPLTDMRIQG